MGVKGFVTDALPELDATPMSTPAGRSPCCRRCAARTDQLDGQFSFEERMGCGFGACMGCTCETKYGSKRVCKDGPVFKKEEIVW